MLQRDPIERFRSYLLREGVLSEEADERVQRDCTAEVDRAVETAEAAEPPRAEQLLDNLFQAGARSGGTGWPSER